MKLPLTLFILGAISVQLSSQNYLPLLEGGRQWTVGEYEGNTVCGYTSAAKHSYLGDTLIGGLTYGKFGVQNITSDGPMFCGPYVLESQVQPGNIYLHEDPAAQRVYAFSPADSSQYLLYDFSLNVGDTLHTKLFNDDLEAELINISLQAFDDGVERRVFAFQGLFGQVVYYEGIGGGNGLFNPFNEGIGFASRLWCYEDATQIIYSPETCLDIVDATEDIQPDQIRLYPTIADNWITVEITDPGISGNLQVDVFDLQGRSALSRFARQVAGSGVQLDVSQLVSGVYLVVVQIGGKRYAQRIIKG